MAVWFAQKGLVGTNAAFFFQLNDCISDIGPYLSRTVLVVILSWKRHFWVSPSFEKKTWWPYFLDPSGGFAGRSSNLCEPRTLPRRGARGARLWSNGSLRVSTEKEASFDGAQLDPWHNLNQLYLCHSFLDEFDIPYQSFNTISSYRSYRFNIYYSVFHLCSW